MPTIGILLRYEILVVSLKVEGTVSASIRRRPHWRPFEDGNGSAEEQPVTMATLFCRRAYCDFV